MSEVQTKYSADQLIERYLQIRSDKEALAEVHKGQMAPLNAALDVIETALQDMLNQQGGQSIKTTHGTAYRSTATSAKVEDWPSFITFVQSSGDTELLVRNVNKTRYEELIGSGVQVPGISITQVQRVNIRRS